MLKAEIFKELLLPEMTSLRKFSVCETATSLDQPLGW